MQNEIILIVSLAASFSGLLVFFRLFGKAGCFVWNALCIVCANLEVAVLVHAFGMEMTLGNTLFASSFLATDFLSEMYGKKEARKAVRIGIAASVLLVVFSLFVVRYAPSENDVMLQSVRNIFSNTPRIITASLLAYTASEALDVQLYHFLWEWTKRASNSAKKFLWLRNNIATLVSQFANIVIFNVVAFAFVYDWKTVFSITVSCYLVYVFTSLLDTPFLYAARKLYESGKITE